MAVHKSFSAILTICYALVNNKVKALPKKRKHRITLNLRFTLSKVNMGKYQALWYSTSIALYIWFLFWMSYDFFVLQKPIVELNAANFVGSIMAIALFWAGIKIFKRNGVEARKLQQKSLQQYLPQKAATNNDIWKRNPEARKLQQKSLQQYLPQKAATNHNISCIHHLGYLHKRRQSQGIPAECLTCERIIQCFSPKK